MQPATQMTLEALRSVPLFASLDDDAARDLRSLLSDKRVPQNTRLFRQGDKGDAMYLIESGRVRISIRDEEDQEVTLAELAQGDFFGEMSIIDGRQRSADAQVVDQFRQAFTLEHIQTAQHFSEREFVFEVHLVIEIGAQAIFFALPVLRHHDDRRLHAGDHRQHEIQHLIRSRIESAHENDRVEDDPEHDHRDRNSDKLPATAKLRDQIRRAIGDSQTRFFFFVRVT